MKIKSLLLAAAAFVALGAGAQTLTANDITITDEAQYGQEQTIHVMINLGEGGYYKNAQFDLTYPENMYTFKDAIANDYAEAGFGVALSGRYPSITFGNNMNPDSPEYAWPNFTVIGSNMTATPTDASEDNEILLLYVTIQPTDRAVENGSYPLKVYSKVIKCDAEGNDAGEQLFGTPEEPIELCNLVVDLPTVAVNDINTAKAVSSVTYYNAAGMASETAFDGINIVVTKYVDGSQSTAKIVK
ncbi:MAG: hypothetical protein J6S96_02740 [Muribaculaceae bacterium]|nr:hypothetical protein [Muribaculaceae bacterium]